jgi:uncharacterized membrane protein YqaE (UPF0057 family)
MMKNVFTKVLMLVYASILVTSCSQITNKALTKSQNQNSFYVEQNINMKSEPLNNEIDIYPEIGFSTSVSKDAIEVTVPEIVNYSHIFSAQVSNSNNTVSIDEIPVIQVVKDDIAFLKSDIGKSREIVDEYKEIYSTDQPVNYSDNSGNSTNGVPFFIIFLFAFFIPPLGVAMMFGITDKFWICLALTLLLWLPGMIYAMIQIFN